MTQINFLPPLGFEPGSLGTVSRWLLHYATELHYPIILYNCLNYKYFCLSDFRPILAARYRWHRTAKACPKGNALSQDLQGLLRESSSPFTILAPKYLDIFCSGPEPSGCGGMVCFSDVIWMFRQISVKKPPMKNTSSNKILHIFHPFFMLPIITLAIVKIEEKSITFWSLQHRNKQHW